MTEYDYSPEAVEAYQKKLKGVGKWAHQTSQFRPHELSNPFKLTPRQKNRRLDSSSSSGSDSDSGVTSISRSRPVYPSSLTVWPGHSSRSRAGPPRHSLDSPRYYAPQQAPPQSALGQRPPPPRSQTQPNAIYVQHAAMQQAPQVYPYPTQRPAAYYQQPVQQQQAVSPTYYVPPVPPPPRRSNTTGSGKPVIPNAMYYSTPVSPVGSPYATPTPVGSPYAYQSRPTSPQPQGKNWLSRMFGALNIRARSASPAPTSPIYYESSASRPTRSRSLGPAYRSDREREREMHRSHTDDERRSKSTRSSKHGYRDDDYERQGRRREKDRHHHRKARSLSQYR